MATKNDEAAALRDGLTARNETDANGEPANVVDGLFALARAVRAGCAHLGTGNAATEMGAIEDLSQGVREAATMIAEALHDLANAVREVRDHP